MDGRFVFSKYSYLASFIKFLFIANLSEINRKSINPIDSKINVNIKTEFLSRKTFIKPIKNGIDYTRSPLTSMMSDTPFVKTFETEVIFTANTSHMKASSVSLNSLSTLRTSAKYD